MVRAPWAAVPEDLAAFLESCAGEPSPALVFRRPVIERNLASALALAGGPDRLRPHVKTHKCAELVRLQVAAGIRKFKVATLAEAFLAAGNGAADALVAYPLVGPAAAAFAGLRRTFPGVRFGACVDSARGLADLAAGAGADDPIDVWLDLDTGMGRTGARAGSAGAQDLARRVLDTAGVRLAGLHVYDGHRSEPDPAARAEALDRELASVFALRETLGLPALPVCGGGTPSFPCWAARREERIECSPGIFLLHDARYAAKFPDLPFEPAALVLARVVSAGTNGRFTLDCGSKSVGPDCPSGERGIPVNLGSALEGPMSEEHWVWSRSGEAPGVGTPVLLVPAHVCTTVAAHRTALVIDGQGAISDRWAILAAR